MVEEKKEGLDLKIAKLILGTDDKCTIEVLGYRFKIHAPSMNEQLQINVFANNLRTGVVQSDVDLRVMTIIIATFEVLCDEIARVNESDGRELNPIEIQTVKDDKGNVLRGMKFWEFIQNKKNPKIFDILLVPMYDKYAEFQNEIAIKYDDLKN
jgi:hypothetical protein